MGCEIEQFEFRLELLPAPPPHTYQFDKHTGKDTPGDSRHELRTLARAADRLAARLKALAD